MSPRQSKTTAAITDAELTVLKVLWQSGPATVRDLLDRLGTDWAYTTVQTLVGRLVEKGHVRADRKDLAHVFTAVMARDELAQRRVEEVASSLLDGAVAPLVLRLVEKGKFTAKEIERFRALLAAAEKKARGGKS
ncbi:MAG TPA: BlaI/MecI/CopY family transcriptional regulator [Planctomycetota bacterium]|nr:BlaI/MecI/CopY family transcriptional regulator [Planctomycetota bacterium]